MQKRGSPVNLFDDYLYEWLWHEAFQLWSMNGKDHVMHEMTKKRLKSLGSIWRGNLILLFIFWKKENLQIENNIQKCKIIIRYIGIHFKSQC